MASEILIPLIIFSSIFGISFVYLTTRNKERLALIEKGADAKLFKSGRRVGFSEAILNSALLAIGIGIGILVGSLFEQNGMESEVAYPASIFIFAGVGLLTGFFMNRKLAQKES